MINIPGQLAIRTINGRNGEFNVGKLSTSIGEFVIKDALLDQHIEGKYRGDFAITEIRPSYYTTGGRLVVEIRAKLDSMTLDDVDNLSDEEAERLSGNEVDPLDEVPAIQQPTAAPAAPPKSPQKPKPLRPAATGDDAPFGMDPPAPAEQAATLDTDADAELFGTVWPLGEIVKLDTTVDRKRWMSGRMLGSVAAACSTAASRMACARLPNRVLHATYSMRSPRREAGHAKRPAGWSCRTFTATTCMA